MSHAAELFEAGGYRVRSAYVKIHGKCRADDGFGVYEVASHL